MITNNLYENILIEPVKKGCDELYAVSGYSSATFLRRHIKEVLEIEPKIKINLIIGMKGKRNEHPSYLSLLSRYRNNLNGYYFTGTPEVHSKTYSWVKNGDPFAGFSGSSNYSQYGFFSNKQQNQMACDDPNEIIKYYHYIQSNSTAIEDFIPSESDKVHTEPLEGSVLPGNLEWVKENESVRISFLSRSGELPTRSGLNWGQRQGRDPNQAYLPIRGDAKKDGFLPEKTFTFTLLTDDEKSLDCTVQQDGRKAISTTNDNSILGKYFRERLNIESGALITEQDLIRYGRTDFLLKKLSPETFYLNFKSTKL